MVRIGTALEINQNLHISLAKTLHQNMYLLKPIWILVQLNGEMPIHIAHSPVPKRTNWIFGSSFHEKHEELRSIPF